MNNYINQLPNDFPKQLIENGYSLEPIGITEMAWKCGDAIEVINYLASKGFAILGGDVYLKNDNGFESTYDSWYINKSTSQSFVEESRKKALEYISKYLINNGDKYIYSLIFEC
jgi:hypothetical protein